MSWRDRARPIIQKVFKEYPPGKEREKALREAYPFGERKNFPYKAWLREIKVQKGLIIENARGRDTRKLEKQGWFKLIEGEEQ